MAHEPNPLDAPLGGPPARLAPDAVDPELLALPAPPSARRSGTLALMAFVVVCALALVGSVRHDLAYFVSNGRPRALGDVRELVPATLVSNTFVSLEGLPTVARAVRFRRVVTGADYVVFPLAGQRTVFVQVRADALDTPRTEWSGRLVTFGALGGRMASVGAYFEDALGVPVTSESFLLVADETPADAWWSVFLAALALAFVAADVALVLRWFRPVAARDLASDGREA